MYTFSIFYPHFIKPFSLSFFLICLWFSCEYTYCFYIGTEITSSTTLNKNFDYEKKKTKIEFKFKDEEIQYLRPILYFRGSLICFFSIENFVNPKNTNTFLSIPFHINIDALLYIMLFIH